MIERIQDLPENVVGFRASGRVTEHDYESVIVPAVELASRSNLEACLLYQLAPDFEGFDPQASWTDPRVEARNRKSWSRVALVTDLGWLRRATRALGFTLPTEVRVFENRALDEARNWLGG